MKVKVVPRMMYDVTTEDGRPIGSFEVTGRWCGMMQLNQVGGNGAMAIVEAPSSSDTTEVVPVYRCCDVFRRIA